MAPILKDKTVLASDPTAPLAVLIHGRAGNVEVMWAFRRCIPEHWSILAFEAPYPDPVGGFSWWLIDSVDTRTGGLSAAALVVDGVRGALERYQLSPARIVGLGFSQGAGTLSTVIQREGLFDAVALLAGFVVELPERPPVAPCTVFMAHGDQDEMVSVERARRGRDYLRHLGYTVEYHEDPVGHKVGTSGMRALRVWLAGSPACSR
jgi:phospholipase/carboxylesterase